MAARKGTPKLEPDPPSKPDAKPEPEGGKETEPPKPDAPEGKKTNPKLKDTRGTIASGGPWDPKRSKEIAKQMPKATLIKSWEPVGTMFATMTDVGLMVLFGPAEIMTKTGVFPEHTMMVQAWASRLAVEPPENIKQILSVNLVVVYMFVFLPRIQRAWAKQIDEKSEKCVATSIKQFAEERRGKVIEKREALRPAGDVPQKPAGDEGRGSGTPGPGPGSRSGS